MRTFATLIALLGLAEASLKTPRTAISPSPSSSSTTLPSTFVTVAPSSSSLDPVNESGSAPQPTSTVATETRCTVMPSDIPTCVSTKTTNSPTITASPEFTPPGANFHEMGAKFVQTTYWSCVTFPLETHCGWHEPILDAGAGRIGCDGDGRAALRAGIVAGVVAGGLVLGM
ncbi:hypothetical protein GGS26DRAFT_353106 [Hypomontagnella submonticulosa]|nr:hypothetical protein GGS26DRAFT_353106 [Hypomontagnella submonticulosa]